MLEFKIYSLMGNTVCVIDHIEQGAANDGRAVERENLAYIACEGLADDERGMLSALLASAVELADFRAGERGGWSVLVSD